MVGRWTIYEWPHHLWSTDAPGDSAGVPVVPSDDAAIERAAVAFEAELGDRCGGDEYLFEMEDDVRAGFLRELLTELDLFGATDRWWRSPYAATVANV